MFFPRANEQQQCVGLTACGVASRCVRFPLIPDRDSDASLHLTSLGTVVSRFSHPTQRVRVAPVERALPVTDIPAPVARLTRRLVNASASRRASVHVQKALPRGASHGCLGPSHPAGFSVLDGFSGVLHLELRLDY